MYVHAYFFNTNQYRYIISCSWASSQMRPLYLILIIMSLLIANNTDNNRTLSPRNTDFFLTSKVIQGYRSLISWDFKTYTCNHVFYLCRLYTREGVRILSIDQIDTGVPLVAVARHHRFKHCNYKETSLSNFGTSSPTQMRKFME